MQACGVCRQEAVRYTHHDMTPLQTCCFAAIMEPPVTPQRTPPQWKVPQYHVLVPVQEDTQDERDIQLV